MYKRQQHSNKGRQEYFTLQEAAEYSRIGSTRLRKLVRDRAIAHRRIGKTIIFRKQDLDSYMDSLTIKPIDAKIAVAKLFEKRTGRRVPQR